MRWIIGIDEVGRGALAGPVVVAAVAAPQGFKLTNRGLGKLRDSKKLTSKKREEWSKFLCSHPRLDYSIARVYPRQIEKKNISKAANIAAERATKRLFENCKLPAHRSLGAGGRIKNCRIFLDGGLYLGNSGLGGKIGAKTIVKGDEKIRAIAAASIVAKVSRDRVMTRLAKKYPQYGFEIHKGYGTKRHLAAVKKHGPSEAHRLTFLEK